MQSKAKKLRKLCEQALAIDGDCDFGKSSYISQTGDNKRGLASIENPKFFKIPSDKKVFGIGTYKWASDSFILFQIEWSEKDKRDRALYLSAIQLEAIRDKFKLTKLGYKNVYRVVGVETDPGMRIKGYGYLLYTMLLTEYGMNILGDFEQYTGARRLWKKLSETDGIQVDIVNIASCSKEFENIELDSISDSRVWLSQLRYEDLNNKPKGAKSKEELKEIKVANNLRLISKNVGYKMDIEYLPDSFINTLRLG
ncbi:hypothetical protein C3I27_04045 [Campylobacter jejuni]|uniref:N-acetyltransferase domain-containing protein n=1 Tax=Campylobacter jejuni TaxID=197 RepID=A0AAX1Z533_CAMJU|nr:hypothetical protein [Campylobacter jejuni]RTI48600.1 hypothetical protein C3I27_04045 [Campylobacter jejuni]